MKVKFLMIAEVEVPDRWDLMTKGNIVDEARDRLNAFMEFADPSVEFKIEMYQVRKGEPALDQDPYILGQGFSVKEKS